MDAKVTWREKTAFVGVAKGGYQVQLDGDASQQAVSPMEMIAIGMAGCTAVDVISILNKKRQKVTGLEVKFHGDRSTDYPQVFTKALITYVVTGAGVQENAVRRAMELSLTKYCPVHAMLSKAFPIESQYEIYEDGGRGKTVLVKKGKY